MLAGGSLLDTPQWRRTLRQPPAIALLVVAASVVVGLVQLDRPARALGLTGPAMLLGAGALFAVAWVAERSPGTAAEVATPTVESGAR